MIKRDEAIAFAPCHVTAFFVPQVLPREPERTGSWGAGLCLSTGVIAEVSVEEADEPRLAVERVDREDGGRVTEAALRSLLDGAPISVTCRVHEGAPVGQGFGVSGASALSAAFGLARCLGKGRSEALRAAHLAEVRNRTGLGDAVASFLGGAVVRTEPGLPPYGTQTRLPAQGEVVVAVVDEPMETATVLRDRETMQRISEVGRACMEDLQARPTPEAIFHLGARFDRETGLVGEDTLAAIEACEEGGVAMAAMLGNTVVAYGDTSVLVDVLQGFGDPFVIPIDQGGLRTLEAMPDLGGA